MAITSLFLIISHDTLRKLTICWVIPSAQQLYWIIYRDVGICEISSRLVELSGQNIRLEDCETNFIFAWVLKFAMAQILNRYIQSLDPSHFMPLCTLATRVRAGRAPDGGGWRRPPWPQSPVRWPAPLRVSAPSLPPAPAP